MLHETHDSLGRRNRKIATSTGKKVSLNHRDIFWLEFLHRHRGPLSGDTLHFATEHIFKNRKSTAIRLGQLNHEKNTEEQYRYLFRPEEQSCAEDDFWQKRVYDLSVAGIRYLKNNGLWHDEAPHLDSWWKHQYFTATITATAEIECRRRGWGYIPGYELLQRAGLATFEYEVEFEYAGEPYVQILKPDDLFAIDYGRGVGYRIFIVEADRGTEQVSFSDARKTYEGNVLKYQQYIAGGLYKEHLGVEAGAVVLNVFGVPSRQESYLDVVNRVCDGKNTYQWTQSVQGQGKSWKPTGPWPHLFEDGWRRAGCPDYRIGEI